MERIKPVGYLKTTKTGKAHISELIRRETGTKAGEGIPFVMNAKTVLLYDPNLNLQELLASIDVLKQDVKLRTTQKEPEKSEQR